MITSRFARSINKRAFKVPSAWANVWIGLSNFSEKDLPVTTTFDTIRPYEPTAECQGYARVAIPNWNVVVPVGADVYAEPVIGAGPHFENTGATAWRKVNGAFIVGSIEAVPHVLYAFWEFGVEIELQPGDQITIDNFQLGWSPSK